MNIPCTYTDGRHRDIEGLCSECFKFLKAQPNKWIQHVCLHKGCQEGYVTVDGNCKLRRPICAAKGELEEIGPGLPKVFRCCPNTPILGNQSKKANTFCEEHMDDSAVGTPNADGGPREKPQGKSDDPLEPEEMEMDTVGETVGCKKPSNILKFYHTTAGILALIKPCGIVVDACEMYTSESLSQVFIFLLQTFCKPSQGPEYFMRLKYLGYDRACQLHPYLVNEAKKGSAGAQLLVDDVSFLVDLFHCKKHVKSTCMPPDDPECRYHPHLARFAEIHGINTQSCEQGFKRLNKYKYATRKMTRGKINLFFHIVNNEFNTHREGQLRNEGFIN